MPGFSFCSSVGLPEATWVSLGGSLGSWQSEPMDRRVDDFHHWLCPMQPPGEEKDSTPLGSFREDTEYVVPCIAY